MMVEKKTSLRVLYTINSSPQYILARSHTRVQITLVPSAQHEPSGISGYAPEDSSALYANVLLKTCLETICRSSPELTHDSTRDFSLYVLDPLESNSAPAPVHINNANGEMASSKTCTQATEQPRGVAVGLGLMSWALAADDSDAMTVVGTLVTQANGQEALEVIFALRETMAVKRPAWNMPPPALPSSSQESNSYANDISSSQESKHQPWYSNQVLTSSSVASSSSQDLTRETLASIQMRAKPKVKPLKPVRQSTVPVTESDKLMSADTFIGPMKKKGRPKASNNDMKANTIYTNAVASGSASSPRDVIVIDGSDSDGTPPTPTTNTFPVTDKLLTSRTGIQDLTKKKRTSQHPITSAFTTTPLVRRVSDVEKQVTEPQPVQVKTEPKEEPSLLDVLAFFSATSSADPSAQNAVLLAALNTIDSANPQGSGPASARNPALVTALRQLLTAYANAPPANLTHLLTPPASQSPTPQQPHSSSTSQEATTTSLDKENVNPKVYLKTPGKDVQAIKVSESPMSSSNTQINAVAGPSSLAERPLLGPSARTNEHNSSKNSLKESVLSSGSEKVVRKRTLSDFMDEKEYGRSKNKGKERERVEKRDGHRHVSSQKPSKASTTDALRHYPRLLASAQPRADPPSNYYRTPLESMTSPARPRSEMDGEYPRHQHTSGYTSQPSSRPPSPKQRISASSPVRGPHQEKKKYVVPEWARTSTSTQPRLSEEAQKALEGLEEKKRLERAGARKRLPSMQARSKSLKSKGSNASSSKSDGGNTSGENEPPVLSQNSEPVRAPIVSSDRPLIAASNIAFPFMITRSSSPPPNAAGIPRTPKTPVRERHHSRPTPGRESDSLFTPIMRSGSLFGSAHSRSLQTPQSVLTSPLGNRKKAKLSSPTKSLLTGKPFSTPIAWLRSALQSSEDSKAEEEEEDPPKTLERELEEAMDDLDCPPSSLPIASSDIDINEAHTSTDLEITIGEFDIEISPVKQHWQGLPPSSPPAPSSPMLTPEVPADDEEMDELPVATDESETDTDMTPCDSDATVDSPADFNDQFDETMTSDSFASFFPTTHSASMDQSSNIMDIFDQFTHLNSDPSLGESTDQDLDSMFQNGLDGIDFTEFWETFKPLVNDNSTTLQIEQNGVDTSGLFDMNKVDGSDMAQFGEIDHVKLADDMQALLSGCLM